MIPEIQANIYWSPLLEKWVAEIKELTHEETCVFYKEHVDRNLVLFEVSRFFAEQTNTNARTVY
jgi:hypothetical protein